MTVPSIVLCSVLYSYYKNTLGIFVTSIKKIVLSLFIRRISMSSSIFNYSSKLNNTICITNIMTLE